MCSGKVFHSLGATQLKALPSQELILKFGTDNKSAEEDLNEHGGLYKH